MSLSTMFSIQLHGRVLKKRCAVTGEIHVEFVSGTWTMLLLLAKHAEHPRESPAVPTAPRYFPSAPQSAMPIHGETCIGQHRQRAALIFRDGDEQGVILRCVAGAQTGGCREQPARHGQHTSANPTRTRRRECVMVATAPACRTGIRSPENLAGAG